MKKTYFQHISFVSQDQWYRETETETSFSIRTFRVVGDVCSGMCNTGRAKLFRICWCHWTSRLLFNNRGRIRELAGHTNAGRLKYPANKDMRKVLCYYIVRERTFSNISGRLYLIFRWGKKTKGAKSKRITIK